MAGVDDIIGDWIRQAERSGELKQGRFWGRPFDLDDDMAATPARLRMAYRMLKNAGYVPHEVAQLNRLAALKEQLATETDPAARLELDREAAELTTRIRLLMSRLQPR